MFARAGYRTEIDCRSYEALEESDIAGAHALIVSLPVDIDEAQSLFHRINTLAFDQATVFVASSSESSTAVKAQQAGFEVVAEKDAGSLVSVVASLLVEGQFWEVRGEAEELRESEARHRIASELTAAHAYTMRVDVDGSVHHEWISDSLAQLLGLGAAGADSWFQRMRPEDWPAAAEFYSKLLSGQESFGEYGFLLPGGDTIFLRDHARPVQDQPAGEPRRVYGAVQDVTSQREAEEALKKRALHDALTGLPNRLLFNRRLLETTESCASSKGSFTVLLMDLDRFKEVNDTLGHQAGDELLRTVAERLQNALRPSDTVARLGGDEFAVILPLAHDVREVELTARRLVSTLELPIHVEGHTVNVGASVGISAYPQHGSDAETLLRRADVAMYVAKRAKIGVSVYDPNRDNNTPRRLAFTSDLRRAINAGDLVLHYQPKIALDSHQLLGVEALVRWRHPEHGLIAPADFIPLVEEAGMMKALSHNVLKDAVRQYRTWQSAGLRIPIAVNVSTSNLVRRELFDLVADLIHAWEVPPGDLTLEVTETTLMADMDVAIEMMHKLRRIGVTFSIDDFGTGYSSLSYLRDLPAAEIKIDGSFVKSVRDDGGGAALVSAAVNVGHQMGMKVVAEGIENRQTWRSLKAMHCDAGQGFYFCPALPPEELAEWVSQWLSAATSDQTALRDRRQRRQRS